MIAGRLEATAPDTDFPGRVPGRCPSHHPGLFYCCRYHVACIRGKPVYHSGVGLSPCVRELHGESEKFVTM